MKLWMVIYLAGKIGGVAGPLPYDLAECQSRIADMQHEARQPPASLGLSFKCEFHEARPVMDSATNGERG